MEEQEQIMKEFNEIIGSDNPTISNEKPPKKKGFKLWKFCLVLFILSLVAMIVYFAVFMLKPKVVMVNGVGKALNSLYPLIEPLQTNYTISDNFSVNSTNTITATGEGIDEYKDILDNVELKANMMYDKANKKALVDMDLNISETNIGFNYYVNAKENYMFLNDVYDKYLKLDDLEEDIFTTRVTIEDINYILNKLKTSLSNNLDDSWFNREIIFDNGPTVISTLNLSNQNYGTLVNSVRTDFLNDTRIVEILSLVYEQEEIEALKTENIEADFNNMSLKIKQSIIQDNLQSLEFAITDDTDTLKLVFEKNDNKINIIGYNDNEVEFKIDITINGKKFDAIITKSDIQIATLKGSEKGNYYTYTLNAIDEYTNETTELFYTCNYIVNDKLTYDITFGVKTTASNIAINSKGIINKLSEDINVDASNSINYEEADMDEISNKLMEKITLIATDIGQIVQNDVNSSINISKNNSLVASAKSLANSYELNITTESLLSESEQVLTKIDSNVTGEWKCIGDSVFSNNLLTGLEIEEGDYILNGITIIGDPSANNVSNNTCSAIRKNNQGQVEILLVANPDGRFGTGDNMVMYGWSNDE